MRSRERLASCFFVGLLGVALAMPAAAAGPRLVRDIHPVSNVGSDPRSLIEFDGALFFSAYEFAHGRELWMTRGSAESTFMVRDINPGPASCLRYDAKLAVVGGYLFFPCDDGENGVELWKTDGTAAGTVMVKDIKPGPLSSWPGGFSNWIFEFTAFGDLLLFGAFSDDGGELWRSDGSEAGTWQVKDIRPGSLHSRPGPVAFLDGVAYFSADDGVGGSELWRSDGTTGGTYKVKEIRSGPEGGWPRSLVALDDRLYFAADDGVRGLELWRSDGTASGTRLVRDIARGPSSSRISFMTVFDGALFFQAEDGLSGLELWRSDGSRAGTRRVLDINPGYGHGGPRHLTPAGRSLYFTADDGVHGRELWHSDGTGDGTVLVDIEAGRSGSYPYRLTELDGNLYFSASRWLMRYRSGRRGSLGRPRTIARFRLGLEAALAVGRALYFVAWDHEHGEELWIYEPQARPAPSGGR